MIETKKYFRNWVREPKKEIKSYEKEIEFIVWISKCLVVQEGVDAEVRATADVDTELKYTMTHVSDLSIRRLPLVSATLARLLIHLE